MSGLRLGEARARRASPGRVALVGVAAAAGAAIATTLGGALAKAAGVDLRVPEGGETIPVAGFATMTGFFSCVGVVIALGLARWSARPARRFVQVTVALTAVSLVPPLVVGADAATTATLVGLHLVAAAVVIPVVASALRDHG